METKLDQKRMESVRRRCGFSSGFEIEAESLEEGDFNDILYFFEKSGGVLREQKRMEAFRDTLEECKLLDIGYWRVRYTWEMDIPTILTGHRSFPFEAWWTMEENFEGLIREFWDSSFVSLMEKLKLLQNHLKKWSGSIKSRKDGLKRSLTRELESLLLKDRDDDTMAKIIDTKIHLNLEIDKDECASTRRRINSITKLVSEDGREITDGSEILEAATGYFEDLFASNGNGDPQNVLEGIESIISHEVNESLLSPFREDKVRTALKDMGPIKAPGLDGFPALFFQQYWHIVGKEVLDFCLGILNGNKGANLANVTEIVIIPKFHNPSSLVNFRPISLCSVLYKIVVKTIANIMQNIIGLCIDEVQSAFVPGRFITDNVLLAYEILHTFRQKRTGKKGYMEIKLDMSKAYDKVEWNFLKEMMLKIGFAHEWVGLIMKCITSVSYAVNINGYRGRVFQPTKGLRQGDPLSPFLFLICSKDAKETVSSLLGVRSSSNPEKYLGLPNVVGRRKKEAFKSILDKISLRIDSWSTRLLSQGGKEIFIKSVLQAIPTYAMSCFLLPKTLCESIENKLARFWWQKGVGRRARVFKAKYFPDCSFRDSNLGSSSSYVWRSIWAAKASLEMGLIWRVGTGENIFVFEDAWIPNFTIVRLTSDFGNLQFVKVAELIKSDVREWNRELISNTFSEAEAEMIFRIPLATGPHEDLMVWKGELSGEFSVRSSYKLLQDYDPTAYALHHIYRDFYNKLWKIDIPLKIKMFIWKISWNYLATRVNMSLRKLSTNYLCPHCGSGEESVNHLFRECPASVTIWKELSDAILVTFPFTDPPGQTIKVNFDDAFDERSKLSASGIVVRDSSGSVLLASTELHKDVDSAFAAEAIACRRASQIALNINRESVIIEGDSLTIIKKCKQRDFDKSQVGSYIHDIQMLKNRFKTVSFEFVPRSANNLAHILASETLKRRERVYLVNGVLSYAEFQSKIDYAREPD
ncbi:reverse transcriptase [Gossypium australe]|uniref:Reverse transcriptase n=1 Tax=Gossypium australe TaxID=47621 RepID=A0A5B6UXZ0_9ROSI|nr:reverse transcriptase [Gossypium australe]